MVLKIGEKVRETCLSSALTVKCGGWSGRCWVNLASPLPALPRRGC